MYANSSTSRLTPVDKSTGVRKPPVSATPARNSDRCRIDNPTTAAVTMTIAANAAPIGMSAYVCDAAQMER